MCCGDHGDNGHGKISEKGLDTAKGVLRAATGVVLVTFGFVFAGTFILVLLANFGYGLTVLENTGDPAPLLLLFSGAIAMAVLVAAPFAIKYGVVLIDIHNKRGTHGQAAPSGTV